jgi:hypothetical protein
VGEKRIALGRDGSGFGFEIVMRFFRDILLLGVDEDIVGYGLFEVLSQ